MNETGIEERSPGPEHTFAIFAGRSTAVYGPEDVQRGPAGPPSTLLCQYTTRQTARVENLVRYCFRKEVTPS